MPDAQVGQEQGAFGGERAGREGREEMPWWGRGAVGEGWVCVGFGGKEKGEGEGSAHRSYGAEGRPH